MTKRALITGATGFTGKYMAAALAAAGYEVIGLARHVPSNPLTDFAAMYSCDLTGDTGDLAKILQDVQPHKVVHLAGIAFVAHDNVDIIYRTHLIGTRTLLEGLARAHTRPQAVLLASSAHIYGNSVGGVLEETSPALPASDYALSKLATEYMAKWYKDSLPIVIARPFNYTGVGQAKNFLLPKIVDHILRHAPVIELGNLDIARDFSDVRLVVQYYLRLLECSAAMGDTFNICSGRAYTLQEVLNSVRTLSGHNFEVQVNPAFVRGNEVKILLGSRTKLEAIVGKVPDIALHETLSWMLGKQEQGEVAC